MKYDYLVDPKNRPFDSIHNTTKLLASPIFGGSVLAKRVDGRRNCLKNRILAEFDNTKKIQQKEEEGFLGFFREALGLQHQERYFILHNVRVKPNYPFFVDIWILVKDNAI